MEAKELFDGSLEWLKGNYIKLDFFVERDIEHRLQKHIKDKITKFNLPFLVFNDWPMESGKRYADLVIRKIDETDDFKVDVAVELKYEPDHSRTGDFSKKKLKYPVVFWDNKPGQSSVLGDIRRVKDFVEQRKATVAYAIFVDEGSHFSKKHPDVDGAKWHKDWNEKDMSVLIVKYP